MASPALLTFAGWPCLADSVQQQRSRHQQIIPIQSIPVQLSSARVAPEHNPRLQSHPSTLLTWQH